MFEVTFDKLLGFVMSSDEIKVDPAKIKAIKDLPVPRTQKRSERFHGSVKLHFSVHISPHR